MANTVLWTYIVLLLAGGIIGFLKAKSQVSLYMSAGFAVAFILLGLPGVFQPAFARGAVNALMALLIIVFAIRLAKTKKFMPAGLMLVITIVALTLRNLPQ